MVQAVVLSLLGGLMGANGVPHFVKGVTREAYPCVAGNSPIRNALAGWSAFVVAGLLLRWADIGGHPVAALICLALGGLCMSLFHAAGGAFRLNSRFGRANPMPHDR